MSLNEPKRYAHHKADLTSMKALLRESKWESAIDPLVALQETLVKALQQYCPRSRPSPYARPAWSKKATELLAGCRRARRQAILSGEPHDSKREKCLRREFQTELRRIQNSSWRQFMTSVACSSNDKNDKKLWGLTKWAKKCTSIQQGPPQLPALRRDEADSPTEDNAAKAEILKERFFQNSSKADLNDIKTN